MKSRRALTLLEVMLAIGILAVAVLSLVEVFVSGLRASAQSLRVTLASEIGREFMETVRKKGYPFVTPGTFNGDLPTPPDATTLFPPAPYPTPTINGAKFVLRVRSATVNPEVVSVEVEVFATGGDGKSTGVPMRYATWIHR